MSGSKDLTFVVEQMDGMKQPKHSSCQLCLRERPLLSGWNLLWSNKEIMLWPRQRLLRQLCQWDLYPLMSFTRGNSGEALPVFVYDLKKLLARAMPELDQAAREPLLLHQFLTGLPVAVSRQLRATGETYTLEAAIARAKLLMTIEDHGQAAAVSKDSAMEQLREQVALLTEQVATLSTSNQAISQPRLRKLPRCFKCNQVGHMQRECPHCTSYRGQAFRRCYTCGKQGHLANNCHQGNSKGMPARGSKYPFQ